MVMKQLQGKTAFITGASRGIGQAIATKFASEGANIVFTHLSSPEQGQALAEELRSLDVRVKAHLCDATDFAATHALIRDTIREFGQLDVLVNNVGIARDQLLVRMKEHTWDEVVRVNLKSVFNTVQAAAKALSSQRSGSIINISSVAGLRGQAGQANYAASKGGIVALTKSIALELGSRNVRSNVIAPGWIDTRTSQGLPAHKVQDHKRYIPLQRIGLPEDVAHCALFLASDASSYITGQVLQVDGGMAM